MSKLSMSIWPIATIILFGIALFFNYTASTGLVSDLDVGEVSDKYGLEITPASWTFSIWAFIYIWQAIWIIFVLILTCKYPMQQIIFGKWFFILYNFGNVFNALWLIIWTNELIVLAAFALIFIASSLVASAYIAHKYMFVHLVKMTRRVDSNYGGVSEDDPDNTSSSTKWLAESKAIKPLIYIFVLNGVPFYATWTVVATHLNIGTALVYEAGMTNTNASILMLSILTCVILFYWFLDFYRFRNYLQYTYSPYAVLIVAFCGIVTNGGIDVEERPSSIFAAVLLAVAVVGTICKVIMGLCMRNKPVEPVGSSLESV